MTLVEDNGIPKMDFLYAERISLQNDCESVFGNHGNIAVITGDGGMYWQQDVSWEQVIEYCSEHGHDLIKEYRSIKKRGPENERAKMEECIEKYLELYGLTVEDVRAKRARKSIIAMRKWVETVAFFATGCTIADIASFIERTPVQVLEEIHDTWCEDEGIGCIDNISFYAFRGLLIRPVEGVCEQCCSDEETPKMCRLSWCSDLESAF